MVHGPFTVGHMYYDIVEPQPFFVFLPCCSFQEIEPPSPVEWPEGMGLSRAHDSRFSLHEWGA